MVTLLALGAGAAVRTASADAALTQYYVAVSSGAGSIGSGYPNAVSCDNTASYCGPANFAATYEYFYAYPASGYAFDHWDGCGYVSATWCVVYTSDPGYFGSNYAYARASFSRPVVSSLTATNSTTQDGTVIVDWTPSYGTLSTAGFTYKCSFDGQPATTCTKGQAFKLPEGTHAVAVTPTDPSRGLTGPATTSSSFRVLETLLLSGPPANTNATSATLHYASLAGTSFECSINSGGTWTACGTKGLDNSASSSYPGLADGAHSVWVRAKDGADVDRSPTKVNWTVDTKAPATTLDPTTGPGQGALQTIDSETFAFASTDPAPSSGLAGYMCQLDDAAWSDCASPMTLSNIPSGRHSFRVQAFDNAGNPGSVATRDWTIAIPDADGDGFNAKVDCNDSNPVTHPGATDIPNNGIDENCDGADARATVLAAAAKSIAVTLGYAYSESTNKVTKFTRLTIAPVPAGATVTVTCIKGSCPAALVARKTTKVKGKKRTTLTAKALVMRNVSGTVKLSKVISKPLRAGTRLRVDVTLPGLIGAVKIMEVGKSKAPKITTQCLPAGAKKPTSC